MTGVGFDRLETGGSFMIRFGWKDYGDQWSVWYKACALRLFQLLSALCFTVSECHGLR